MRLAIITHTFPPSAHSNAKRPFYLARAALEEGWNVDVFTSVIGVEPGQKETLVHPNLRVFRSGDPVVFIQRKLKRRRRLASLFSMAANGALWPDFCALWARRMYRRAAVFDEYDRVLAFVFPPSVLLAGSKPGLVDFRWVFDLQESVSPQFERFPRKSVFQRLLTPKLFRLEKKTLHQAGRVVFTAETNRRVYHEKGLAPEDRSSHIPYFYDAEVFSGEYPVRDGFEIHYYGGFDAHGDRNPGTFLKSLALFLKRNPGARGETKFVFYGNWLPGHDGWIEELRLNEDVEIHPPVPYEEYLEAVRRSPVLLLVVAKAHDLFMPSKIVDYFGAKRPILAFVPESSEMRKVLDDAGMSRFAVAEKDVEEGGRAMEQLWEMHRNGKLRVSGGKTEFWSSETQIPKYMKLLEPRFRLANKRCQNG